MFDLHCHSNYSDGLLPPQALIDKAITNKVQVLAITDHDTIEGFASLPEKPSKLTLIPGIELSVRWRKYDIHVLGLNIDKDNALLKEVIRQQNDCRLQRSIQMAERLEALGCTHVLEKASQVAGHTRIGRPHFARVLMDEGKASSMQAAFKQYLSRGRPGYIPTAWISLSQAVECIVASGGDAVLAHPLKYRLTRTKLHEFLYEFTAAGGTGLEVVSGKMTPAEIHDMIGVCQRFQLLASTGSDYHGDAISRVSLGCQAPLPNHCKPVWHNWGFL